MNFETNWHQLSHISIRCDRLSKVRPLNVIESLASAPELIYTTVSAPAPTSVSQYKVLSVANVSM